MIRVLSVLVSLAVPALQAKPDVGLPLIPVFVTSTDGETAQAHGFAVPANGGLLELSKLLGDHRSYFHEAAIQGGVLQVVTDRSSATIVLEYHGYTTKLAPNQRVFSFSSDVRNDITVTGTMIISDYRLELTNTDKNIEWALLGLAKQVEDFARTNRAKLVK